MTTEEQIQAYLASAKMHGSDRHSMCDILPSIKCADGATISVQASRTHYCQPRDDSGPWYQVECGFPSVKPQPSLLKYADDEHEPTETVYGYVPLDVVACFIEIHGGFAKTPNRRSGVERREGPRRHESRSMPVEELKRTHVDRRAFVSTATDRRTSSQTVAHYVDMAQHAEDQRDAKRYRWLRAQENMDIAACWIVEVNKTLPMSEALDAAVDAAIAKDAK